MNKFAFFTLLLAFAVFFNSIELGRSQQSDPEASSDDEKEYNRRNRGQQRNRQGQQRSQVPNTRPPGTLEAPGTHRHPLLQGPPLPPHYVSAARRRQYGLPEPQGIQSPPAYPPVYRREQSARIHPFPAPPQQ